MPKANTEQSVTRQELHCQVTRLLVILSQQEKEKDKEKTKEKDKDSKEKEKDKKLLNGHLFTATSVVAQATCYHCMKPFNKDSYYCASKSGGFPLFLLFFIESGMQNATLHFIFLLLEGVRWEGDFGDSDSWSNVLPCGNWTEMSRGCMELC